MPERGPRPWGRHRAAATAWSVAGSLAGIALLLTACSTARGATTATTAPGAATAAPVIVAGPASAVMPPSAGSSTSAKPAASAVRPTPSKPAASAVRPTPTRPPASAGIPHGPYVALGDSYTSGLDIPEQTGAIAGCSQSTASYPYLVARTLRLALTDMSCSGATIADLTAADPTGDGTNPAQLSALSASTALVTVSIGGNDVGLIGVITQCAELDEVPGMPCADYYTSGGTNQIQQRIVTMTAHLAAALAQIRQLAPHARVYVVGYPEVLPAAGDSCAPVIGIAAVDVTFINAEERDLNTAMRQDAAAAGDGYVDTYGPSAGHDACAAPASRWIEPLLNVAPAAPLHPDAAGELGMASAVTRAITTG